MCLGLGIFSDYMTSSVHIEFHGYVNISGENQIRGLQVDPFCNRWIRQIATFCHCYRSRSFLKFIPIPHHWDAGLTEHFKS